MAMDQLMSSTLLHGLVLILLCIGCYWNTLHGDLVHDDVFAIRDNADIRPDTPLSTLLSNDFWGKPMSAPNSHKSYRPLCVLTFRINYLLHGLEPWGYHAVNIALHTMSTLVFWCLCKRVVFKDSLVDIRASISLSFQAAVIFAVHPIHTEAVAGVVGRADLLACLLFQISFICYVKSANSVVWYKAASYLFISVVTGTAAMLSKEHGITVFGVCFLYDIFLVFSKQAVERAYPIRSSDLLTSLLRLCVLVFAAISSVAFRIRMLHGHLPHFSSQDNPASFVDSMLTRILTYTYLYYFNAKLLVAPITLSYDWQMGSIPLVETITDVRNFGTLFFFCGVFALCWIILNSTSKKDRYLLFCAGCLIIIPFLPASNIFVRVGFVVAERILYIPSMGYCILLVYGFDRIHKTVKNLLITRIITLSLFMILCLYIAQSVDRNTVWKNRESLFRSGVETLPHNAKAHYNFANFLKDNNNKQEAITHYTIALRLAPDHASSHNNLATLLTGKEAEIHFRQAVKYNPQHSRAYYNLGNNLRDQGRYNEAILAFRNSLHIDPKYVDAMMSLANTLSVNGNNNGTKEAIHILEKANQLKPFDSDVLNNYASLLNKLDYHSNSIAIYEQALQHNPHHYIAMSGLARVLRKIGQNDKAEELFKRSLSIKNDTDTLLSLGGLYFNTGRIQEAKQIFKKVMQLNPASIEGICGYSQSLSHLGDSKNAINDLLKALQKHSKAPCIHLQLASYYANQNNLIEALKHSQSAVDYSSNTNQLVEAYQIHGTILKDSGKLSEAAKSFKMAVKTSPRMVSALLNLGAVLHLMGDYDGAEQYYTSALKIDPKNPILSDNLEKVSRLKKQQKREL